MEKWKVQEFEMLTLYSDVFKIEPLSFIPGRLLPYMDFKVMCGSKGYGFSAVLDINRVPIFAL